MNSFAFWCRPNEGGGEDRVDGRGIEAMVNINLWIADSLEHGKSSTTAFDFGLMLSSACSDGQDDGKAGDTAQGDEKSEDLKGDVSILDSIKGISLYCPFKIDKSCFSDLMPKLNKETLGAIFNDRCRVYEVDFTSRYVEVNLANDESRGPFLLLSCDALKFEECDGGAATVINIDFPHIAREVGGESRRVYVRFRLYIDQNSGLAKRNDSRDRLFTSAFSREEAIDLRINDYRTLSDEMREKVDGVDPGAYPLKSVIVHTLLMARTSVAVESFEDLHEKRLLEGDSVWGGYLPEGLSASDVVAWHWRKKIDRPGDGYKMYLKLSYSVCNWGTIALYLLFLTAFSVFTNVLATVLCDLTRLGAIGAAGASLAACVVLLVVFGVFRVRKPLGRRFRS